MRWICVPSSSDINVAWFSILMLILTGSGWKSPSWNWGYAQGAGHDCAMICRTRWGTTENRKLLLENLLNPPPLPRVDDGEKLTVEQADNFREPKFEEVKLILGLAFQRGRWDGSDGGRGGYSEVLSLLASAERYESDDEEINSKYLIQDMKERFQLLSPSIEAKEEMANLHNLCEDDIDMMRRKCSALVLWQMGFIENGL